MNAPAQGATARVIAASPETVWALLIDSTRLPQWMPVVTSTTGRTEALDMTRICEVELGGKSGRVEERCDVFEPATRIGWTLVADTLGFSRLLSDFHFDFSLEPIPTGTRVVNTTYYRPKGPFAQAMSLLVLRRKFGQVREGALAALATLAESDPPAPVAGAVSRSGV